MIFRRQAPIAVWAAQVIGAAIAVYVVGRLGRVTPVPSGPVMLLWTPSGIALAAWLVFGSRIGPGIGLGSFLLELTKPLAGTATHATAGLEFAAVIATGTVLQAGAGAWVLRHVLGNIPSLNRLKDILALLGLGSLVSTVVGSAARAVCRTGAPQGILHWPVLQADARAELMGILVFAPLALVLLRAKPRAFRRLRVLRLLESAILFLVLPLVVTQLPADRDTDIGAIIVTVSALWAALRFGKIGTGAMLGWIAMILMLNVRSQTPLFGSIRANAATAPADAQLLLGTFCITFWTLAAILEERERAARDLRENEARFRQFGDSMSHIIWMMTPDKRRILYANRAFEQIFGRKREDLYRDKYIWLAGIHPDDRQRIAQSWVSHDVSLEYREEYRVVHPDGTVRWLRETSLPLRDEQGEISMFGGTAEDITQSRQVAHELARQQSELLHVSRLSSVGQLMAALSHEVAQPMSAIGTFATVCAKQLESDSSDNGSHPDKVKQCIDAIAAENRRCRLILRRLRDYTRKTPPRRIRCDPNAVLRESIDLVLHDLRRLDIEVHCDLSPAMPLVSADPIQLQQVIINLLTNARDAMLPVDALRRVVRLCTRRQADSAMIEVADRGIGLPADDQGRIFEPFFTTKPEGMGIGLSICKTIVEEHGGEIHGFNNDSGGATFQIVLPVSEGTGNGKLKAEVRRMKDELSPREHCPS